MDMENLKTDSSLAGGVGLAVLGATCCALPIVLVALGLGGAVASLVSALPVLAWLSQYKAVTFTVTALVLIYSGWRLRRVMGATTCSLEAGRRLRWQKRVLTVSALIWLVSVFAAYALLPLVLWWERV